MTEEIVNLSDVFLFGLEHTTDQMNGLVNIFFMAEEDSGFVLMSLENTTDSFLVKVNTETNQVEFLFVEPYRYSESRTIDFTDVS